MKYIKLDNDNIIKEHICCAISDKKHQEGVDSKKKWIQNQFVNYHTFYKLNEKGKVFIEYVDAEEAWTPIIAPNYLYVYCLWVSGSFKGKGHSTILLDYCIEDAKKRNKSGICVIAGTKKTPFLSDKSRLLHAGFKTIDKIDNYELMALTIDNNRPMPKFSENAKTGAITNRGYVVFFSPQCPYILNCIKEIQEVAKERHLELETIEINSRTMAQDMPCIFNNFALFKDGKFVTHHLLNRGFFEKLIAKEE